MFYSENHQNLCQSASKKCLKTLRRITQKETEGHKKWILNLNYGILSEETVIY